eukprot:gene2207-33767_t
MTAVVSSAAGLLSLLEEDHDDIKRYALQNLDKVVHDFWFQISGSIASVEALYEDEDFAQRELAALVASKVFYHLGELDDALTYALGAGDLFDVNDQSEYVQTLIARCLDKYFELRGKEVEQKQEVEIDPRLVAIVERMLDKCCEQGQSEQAVGVALEARRLDKVEEVIMRSSNVTATLKYSLKVCQELLINRDFREQVLRLLVRLYEGVPEPDVINICQCLMFLDDALEVAKILVKLLQGSEDDELLAYQVCFDLVDNEMQSFLIQVQGHMDAVPAPHAPPPAAEDEPTVMDTDADGEAAQAAPLLPQPTLSPEEQAAVDAWQSKMKKVKDILSGFRPISLQLDFLYTHNHSDLQVLKNIKACVDGRVSVTHSATIMANAFMHAGTTVDTFLRENLEWLSRATNWAKFSATAGLGVIHRGHLEKGQALMAPYLPRNGSSGSPFSEGGALYALGLIYANHGQDIRTFLLEALRNTGNEVIQHGACLGLGLAALGTEDEEIVEDVKNVLYTDSAVAGEAAGLSMGLLLVGSGSDKAQEMLAYAHDTQHEKIIRGVAMGLAMISYGREEAAETLIEQMTRDQDPIIRYGGMFVIGMAYRGTDNNGAVQKLLHFAVSDVSDDVRRAAVMCLGFVLMGVPHQCPKIVALLAESFNPHVRYGAAMAVGLACAATGLRDAMSLLEPMLQDSVDFVRQGALIALSLVLVQQPESRVSAFRKRLEKFVGDKHEEVMCKMGAIMATGILDAGGRNVTIGVRARSGYFRRTSVIGLAIFTQYWYWYPFAYFLSLTFQPTAIIGVNRDMAMPKFSVNCACRPSLFAYPPALTAEKKSETSKVPTAVLSTTAKAKERARKKEAEKKATTSSSSAAKAEEPKAEAAGDKMDTDAPGTATPGEEVAEAPKKEEPSSFVMENPGRVVPAQVKFISFSADSRWAPVKRDSPAGILVLKDLTPGEPVDLITSEAAVVPEAAAAAAPAAPAAAAPAAAEPAAGAAADDEPPPPAPFEYRPS